jgi:hypothetical protein
LSRSPTVARVTLRRSIDRSTLPSVDCTIAAALPAVAVGSLKTAMAASSCAKMLSVPVAVGDSVKFARPSNETGLESS